ncbi:MAG: YeeE/YedE thiosulfate transporter family protein, partial [Candidatus Rokuibacteriota bacterium]
MNDLPWMFFGSALGVGAVFGYIIQRGGFCLTRALSNVVLMRDGNVLRAYLFALLVAMVGVQLIETLGLVDIPVRPLRWLS